MVSQGSQVGCISKGGGSFRPQPVFMTLRGSAEGWLHVQEKEKKTERLCGNLEKNRQFCAENFVEIISLKAGKKTQSNRGGGVFLRIHLQPNYSDIVGAARGQERCARNTRDTDT